ncbi:MAG TPA: hypothetical protein DEP35_12750 [Deltaproteobacteria bacterium]|nr:hypothetical protein [Deltaproteobacteria bacterium]
MKGTGFLLLCALLVACGPDRVAEIDAEIEKLSAERVELSVVTAARSEADAAEHRLAEAQAGLDRVREEGKRLANEKAQLEAAIAHEGELVEQARGEIAAAQQATATELAEIDKKDGEIAQARARAMGVREQAAVLAREIRPGDPAWATERRVKSVQEFIAKVARDYPDDPVVAELARSDEQPSADPAEAGALAAQKAARLRDRFTRIYDLETPEVSAGAKAPAAPK